MGEAGQLRTAFVGLADEPAVEVCVAQEQYELTKIANSGVREFYHPEECRRTRANFNSATKQVRTIAYMGASVKASTAAALPLRRSSFFSALTVPSLPISLTSPPRWSGSRRVLGEWEGGHRANPTLCLWKSLEIGCAGVETRTLLLQAERIGHGQLLLCMVVSFWARNRKSS